jgi:hypothetical protein
VSSAGASSRLLANYPSDIKSTLLDVLFTPNHVAGVHILKGVAALHCYCIYPSISIERSVVLQWKSAGMASPRTVSWPHDCVLL